MLHHVIQISGKTREGENMHVDTDMILCGIGNSFLTQKLGLCKKSEGHWASCESDTSAYYSISFIDKSGSLVLQADVLKSSLEARFLIVSTSFRSFAATGISDELFIGSIEVS